MELLRELLKKSEDNHSLYVFLKGCFIVDRNENKIIIVCQYYFHREALNKIENKSIIEENISKILKTKISVEFITFNEAIDRKYKLALKEKGRIDKMEKEECERERKETEKRELEMKTKRINERIENRIPPKFKNAELENSLKIIQNYFEQEEYKRKGLFLFGNFGTGKTYNIYALAKSLIRRNINVWVFNLPRILNTIRASFSKQEVFNEETGENSSAFVKDMSDIERLIDIDILIIDDIGAEKPSDWVAETLYYLINSRYENMKTTIFTSNLSLDKLADKIGDRIVSRIAEMCDIYEVKGEDRRLKK